MSFFPEIASNPTLLGPSTQNAPTSSSLQQHRHPISLLTFDIIVALLCIVLAAFILCVFLVCKRLAAAPSSLSIEEENDVHRCATPRTFSEIESSTDSFGNRRLMGKGRYGSLYRAIFPDGQVLAVKRIEPSHVLYKAGSSYTFSFSAEIRALSRAQHPNIVPIMGYCETPAERILITQFMSSRSLQF